MEDQDKAPVDALKLHEFIQSNLDRGFSYAEVYRGYLLLICQNDEGTHQGEFYSTDMISLGCEYDDSVSAVVDSLRFQVDRWIKDLIWDLQNDFEMELVSNAKEDSTGN